jgi:two-component system, LuxR family, response regulator FixJ
MRFPPSGRWLAKRTPTTRLPDDSPAAQAAPRRSGRDDAPVLPATRMPVALDVGGVVHVVDNDEAVRWAIATLLRSAGIPAQTYPDGLALLDALPAIDVGGAGCVLADLRMPGLDGLELLHRLRARGFRRPVVIITGHGDIPTAVRAMRAGAADFLEKPFDEDALLSVARAALAAPGPHGAGAASEAAARIAALSPREREVLDRLVAGMGSRDIARELGISPRTVDVHRARLLARLGAGSLAEAVRVAVLAERRRHEREGNI